MPVDFNPVGGVSPESFKPTESSSNVAGEIGVPPAKAPEISSYGRSTISPGQAMRGWGLDVNIGHKPVAETANAVLQTEISKLGR